jgi:hypothetical protein
MSITQFNQHSLSHCSLGSTLQKSTKQVPNQTQTLHYTTPQKPNRFNTKSQHCPTQNSTRYLGSGTEQTQNHRHNTNHSKKNSIHRNPNTIYSRRHKWPKLNTQSNESGLGFWWWRPLEGAVRWRLLGRWRLCVGMKRSADPPEAS